MERHTPRFWYFTRKHTARRFIGMKHRTTWYTNRLSALYIFIYVCTNERTNERMVGCACVWEINCMYVRAFARWIDGIQERRKAEKMGKKWERQMKRRKSANETESGRDGKRAEVYFYTYTQFPISVLFFFPQHTMTLDRRYTNTSMLYKYGDTNTSVDTSTSLCSMSCSLSVEHCGEWLFSFFMSLSVCEWFFFYWTVWHSIRLEFPRNGNNDNINLIKVYIARFALIRI